MTSSGEDSTNARKSAATSPCSLDRVQDEAVGDGVGQRMEPELERGRDPEVRPGSSEAPEEVGILVLARTHDPAVCGHELDGKQVVDRQAVLAVQPSHAAAEGEPGDAGVGDDTDGADEVERLRRVVELGQERTAVHARRTSLRVDLGPAHA